MEESNPKIVIKKYKDAHTKGGIDIFSGWSHSG
jgi:hypothetical protein